MAVYSQRTELHDCQRGAEDRFEDNLKKELLIVEGDSASKSVLRFRDRAFQAVLPMQGKPLNAWKASPGAVAKNALYRRLIDALGAGWGADFDSQRVAFGRVLMLFDPDADGIHCGVLVSLFFHRWMPELIEAGRLFVVRPPLFEIDVAGSDQRFPAYTEDDLRQKMTLLTAETGREVGYRRFRGLASLPATILQDGCLNPVTRRAERINDKDIRAMKRIFHMPDA